MFFLNLQINDFNIYDLNQSVSCCVPYMNDVTTVASFLDGAGYFININNIRATHNINRQLLFTTILDYAVGWWINVMLILTFSM